MLRKTILCKQFSVSKSEKSEWPIESMSCDENDKKKRLGDKTPYSTPGVYRYSFRSSVVRVMIGSGYG